MNREFIPVQKILRIINSCETSKQLDNCLDIIDNYVSYTKSKGLVNPELLKLRLLKEFKQKKFQINMIKLFVKDNKNEFEKGYSEKLAKNKSKLQFDNNYSINLFSPDQ